MKAAYIEKFSPEIIIKVGDVPKKELMPEEVSIRVAYAGVNPVDWKFAEGRYAKMEHHFPIILGWEAAGTVAECGKKVKGFKKGDEVYVFCRKPILQWGSWAEYLNVSEMHVAHKPKNLTMAQAASIPLAGLTAWQALFDKGGVKAGQTVLIHAGGGGVGGFAIQWAKHHKAHVITTASSAKIAYVKELGADEVIDYQKTDFVKEVLKKHPKGIDFVLDSIGGETYKKSFEVLKPGGKIVSLLEQPNQALAQKYKVQAEYLFVEASGKQLLEMALLFENSMVKLPKIMELPLMRAGAAIEEMRKGHTMGKIVLKIA
jgi:NADPH2:quinone reductase